MVPAVNVAVGLRSVVTSISRVSVVVRDVLRKLIVAVLVVELTTVVLTSAVEEKLALSVEGSFNVNVNVTPLGILLNVNRTFVLFGTPALLFESCVGLLKADAKPSAKIIDAVGSTLLRFVNITEVP